MSLVIKYVMLCPVFIHLLFLNDNNNIPLNNIKLFANNTVSNKVTVINKVFVSHMIMLLNLPVAWKTS
jgi:hypothetical protein